MVRSSTTPQTVEEARNELRERGSVTSFQPRPISHVECQACHAESSASPDLLVALHRVMGEGQDAIVGLLQCPTCHRLGTLVVSAGPAAPEEDAGVLAALLDDESPFIAHG